MRIEKYMDDMAGNVIYAEQQLNYALASDTRKCILKCLSQKNHRPSDLSRELKKNKSTIVQHLEILYGAGLIERLERDGHKWIFYKLSKKGEVFFPNMKKRIWLYALGILSAFGAIASMIMMMQPQAQIQSMSEYTAPTTYRAGSALMKQAAEQTIQQDNSVYSFIAIASIAMFILTLAALHIQHKVSQIR